MENISPSRNFSIAGLSFFILITVSLVSHILLSGFLQRLTGPEVSEMTSYILINAVSLYIIAFFFFWLIIRKVPEEKRTAKKIKPGTFVIYFLMCLPLMYAGNILGIIVNLFFEIFLGYSGSGSIQDLISSMDIRLNVIFFVILAPVFEELVFRKILIDRVIKYGEVTAILISSLFFGLFHGNFGQFFYAFAVGAIFSIVYIRYSNILYPILLHGIINFMGAVIAPLLVRMTDSGALEVIAEADPDVIETFLANGEFFQLFSGLLAAVLYLLLLFILSVSGLILLIIKRKMVYYSLEGDILKSPAGFRKVFLNPGTLLFILAAVSLFAINIIL